MAKVYNFVEIRITVFVAVFGDQELVLVRNFDFRSILQKTLKQCGVKIEITELYLSVLSLLSVDEFV